MRAALNRFGRWLCRNLAILLVVLLCALLIASEAARMAAKNEAGDYRSLYLRERLAHRNALHERMADLEARIASLPADEETAREYQDRLSDVRRRFAGIVRGEAPAPPACAPAKPTPPAAAPAPGTTGIAEIKVCSGEARERLAKLQAWVREHMLAYHGVKV